MRWIEKLTATEILIDILLVLVGVILFTACKSVEKEGLVHTPLGSFTQEEWKSHESNVN